VFSTVTPLSIGFNVKPSNKGTEYWALLIAVGVYADHPDENIPPMLERIDDLYDILITSPCWQESHIKVIKGEDATVINIIQGLQWLDKMDKQDDISIVYISTHGGQISRDIWPRDEADGKDEILASYWGFTYPNTNIWDDELNFLLSRLDSKGVCLIIDSCHAGGFNDSIYWKNVYGNSRSIRQEEQLSSLDWMKGFAEDVRGRGRVVLMACPEERLSGVDVFSPFLIDGLRGFADSNSDDIVTAEELFFYADQRIFSQQPTIYDDYPGELPIMVIPVKSKTTNVYKDEGYHIMNEKSEDSSYINSIQDENSIVCGYITDEVTGDPIYDANARLDGLDMQGNYYRNNTKTDINGFYSMNAKAGRIAIRASAKGYFWNQSDGYDIDEFETIWVNISIYPRPTVNSVVCGFITDEKTNEPINEAEANAHWTDGEGHFIQNETRTDVSGFYTIGVPAGIIYIRAQAGGYFNNKTKDYIIDEFETLWINISLYPRPPENSIVCGYITDEVTNEPLKGAYVEFDWQDGQGHTWWNKTEVDTQGFYSMYSSAGEVYLFIEKSGYCDKKLYRNDVMANETLWVNVSLVKDVIKVDITKPLKAINIFNHRLMPFPRTIIIGGIEIEAFVHDYQYYRKDAERVEFYIDGQLRSNDTEFPFSWMWRLGGIIEHKHTIKVIAYDDKGYSAMDEIDVWKFF
jgi:hypothetical protein